MSEKLIQKALVNAVDGNAKDFMTNIQTVFTGKLKSKVDSFVKEQEKILFKNYK